MELINIEKSIFRYYREEGYERSEIRNLITGKKYFFKV